MKEGLPFDLRNHLVCQLTEIRTLRDVLPHQPIYVLIGASFPGVVRSREIELSIESFRNLLVTGEFLSVVSRYCVYLVLVWQQRLYRRAGQRDGFLVFILRSYFFCASCHRYR